MLGYSNTFPKGLVGYWKFNEGKGWSVKDLSGFKNNIRIHNGSWEKD